MRSTIYTILLIALTLINTQAQTTLEGKITDANTGEPLLFANISLYQDDILIKSSTSDLEGSFFFLELEPGIYAIEASSVGYLSQKQSDVILKLGRKNRLDFALSQNLEMDEVIVHRIRTRHDRHGCL